MKKTIIKAKYYFNIFFKLKFKIKYILSTYLLINHIMKFHQCNFKQAIDLNFIYKIYKLLLKVNEY